jgi:hypothetical protein
MSEEHLKILPECIEKFGDIKLIIAEVKGDVSHIKSRIDNGMSKTISEIHDMLTELKPKIAHHANVIKRIEDGGWALAYGFVGVIALVVIWSIAHGFTLKGV